MKVGIYTTAFNVVKNNFDYKEAINNWLLYADIVSIAVNTSDDETYEVLEDCCKNLNTIKNGELVQLISIIKTDFSYDDPFCYGKIENAALQNLKNFNVDLYIQQNLDEMFKCDTEKLRNLYELLKDSGFGAYWIPTIDLYGDKESYVNIGKKWYLHLPNYFRGPVKWGIKSDGRPNYNITSGDELLDWDGNLVKAFELTQDYSIEHIRKYVEQGYPISYHLGYLNLKDRADRAKWWKSFWEKATNGDKNTHITDVDELLKRETRKHGLPLWETI